MAFELERGVLFYATLYITSILIAVFITTGRWIFLLIILITVGLSLFMNHAIMNFSDHLTKVGIWSENLVKSIYNKVTGYLEKTDL